MSDDTTDQTDTTEVTEPKEIDWKAEARKHEQRAKENLAKAKANETAAQRLAQIEAENKTEAEKAQERLEAAEKRANELELKATRAEVAAAKGIPAALLSGSTQEELEASAEALIAFRGETASTDPATLVIPAEGGSPATALNGDGLESALKSALGIAS